MGTSLINKQMESNLDNWFDNVMTFEGGFANRPLKDDPGGITNKGIILPTFFHAIDSGILPNHEKTVDSLKTLTDSDCRKIADKLFFRALGFNKIQKEGIAVWCFENKWGSSDPQKYCFKGLQRSVNEVAALKQSGDALTALVIDGDIGKKTIDAINSLTKEEVALLVKKLFNVRMTYLKSCSNWEANKNGWTKRVKKWFTMYCSGN